MIEPLEGTEGQDRESYSDTQDRDNYELDPDDPCKTGEHCRHKNCINHHDYCCWCGEPMETWT